MDPRRPLDARATSLMLVLCAIWALQQVLLKATAQDMAPVWQIALRSGAAALLVALLMAARGTPIGGSDGSWRAGVVAGLLFGLEFLLVGESLRLTSAAHAVVFLYTAPIFAALGLHWRLPSERLAGLQWLGIALAFGGIVLAFVGGSQASAASGVSAEGDLLALLAGLAWGATTVVVRCTRLAVAPATRTLLYQLAVGALVLGGFTVATGQTRVNGTPLLWGGMVFQVLVVAFASFLAWFWLLRKYLASRLGVFTFLTPLLGVMLSAWLLGEPIEPRFMLAAVLVLLGILLVSGHGWVAQQLSRLRTPSP